MRPRLILVPTDFSDASKHALRFAARLAERYGANIRLMYADYFVPPVDFAASAAVQYALSSDEAADAAKKQLIKVAEESLPRTVKFETRVVIDSPVAAIVDEARSSGADLVVLGTHGRTGFRRLVVGSVAESVIRFVAVPVITVSPLTATERISAKLLRIVVPIDYTPESREALRTAASLADSQLARIVCVRCSNAETADLAAAEIVRMQEFTPSEILEQCQYKLLPADDPAGQIIHLAKLLHANMIAVASPSARTTAEVMRGSVAERLIERSDCPVLVVNETTVLKALAKADENLVMVN